MSKPEDKKDENEYYAGNGTAIVGPAHSRTRPPGEAAPRDAGAGASDTVTSLFDKARELGARNATNEDLGVTSPAFAGAGRRLGFAPGPSPVVDDGREEIVSIRVTFYSNGVTVDDGPLMALESPEALEILEPLNRGIVPPSLAAKATRRTKFDVVLVDKKTQEYVKRFAAFEGAGRTLAADPAATAAATASASGITAAAITADAAQPTGRVMLQLPNGERRPITVNPARHTVADLFGDAAFALGVAPGRLELHVREVPAGMRRLDAGSAQTLQEAKCIGAVVMVKTN
jgi:UBX domain-containing protein 1